jgi:hypothetical protein
LHQYDASGEAISARNVLQCSGAQWFVTDTFRLDAVRIDKTRDHLGPAAVKCRDVSLFQFREHKAKQKYQMQVGTIVRNH